MLFLQYHAREIQAHFGGRPPASLSERVSAREWFKDQVATEEWNVKYHYFANKDCNPETCLVQDGYGGNKIGTVTICNYCFDASFIGNFNYGFNGSYIIREAALRAAAELVARSQSAGSTFGNRSHDDFTIHIGVQARSLVSGMAQAAAANDPIGPITPEESRRRLDRAIEYMCSIINSNPTECGAIDCEPCYSRWADNMIPWIREVMDSLNIASDFLPRPSTWPANSSGAH